MRRQSFVGILIALLAVAFPLPARQGGASDPLGDWDRVASVAPGRTVIVKTFARGKKAKGELIRADERSVVVRTEKGDVEILREDVRRVVLRRRVSHRATWIGAAAGFGVLAAVTGGVDDFVQPQAALVGGAVGAGLGALGGLAYRGMASHKLLYEKKGSD